MNAIHKIMGKIPTPDREGAEILKRLWDFAESDGASVMQQLETSTAGLTHHEAIHRTEKYGPNEVAREKPLTWYVQLLLGFKNPFVLLLIALAVISYLTGDARATIVMCVMVTASILLRFIQEYRTTQAAEKLKAMVTTTCTVLRCHKEHAHAECKAQEIPLRDLVPGDIVLLSAGDMIPADVRILQSKDLFVSQSSLTGESIPVEKHSSLPTHQEHGKGLDIANVCFMGTNVVSGSGTVVVLSTGVKTYFGILAKRVMSKQAPTSFEVGLNKVTFLFLRFIGIMVPLVFILNGFSKGSWTDAFFFAVSVAVGLTPEMLPMVVTSNLAKGAYSMAQKQVIAKQLNAIQNFGAMDVLCTDKTGTLTLDKVVLEQFCDVQGKQDETVLRYAYINSFFQTGLKGLLDRTILDREKLAIKDIAKVDEIPFDFERKIMSVAVSMNSKHRLIAKGAPEEIFKRCTCYKLHGRVYPIEKRHTQFLRDEYDKLSAQGFRVLAVAYKETSMEKKVFSKEDEHGLILRGYLAFLDPPKPMAKETLHALHGLGIEVKVLTGDNALVTRKICGDVGLDVKGMMTGDELAAVPDDKLRDVVREVTVFARLSPLQKEQIVRALHGNGHVVGFLGDGINDAPALKAADVGISVNNAVDIAKESADLILLHKNLFVLKEGVIEGRKTFGNTMKYIKATASSNFGNVFSVLGASAILPFLPMLPIHLLIQNLLYDFSQTSIPFDEMDPEYLQKPRKWNSKDIGRYMVFIGPISSIFDYTTFALLWFVFGANTIAHAALFQTGWFVEGLLTQTLIIHMLRTEKIPFFQSRASFPVLTLTAIIMAVGIALPYTGVGAAIGLVPLPLGYYPWLLVTLLCYCALTQLVKVWYIRRFKEWI